MNKQRRKIIHGAIVSLQGISEQIDAVTEEEQEVNDNLPESIRHSDRGQLCEAACQQLQEAQTTIESLIENLEEAKLC